MTVTSLKPETGPSYVIQNHGASKKQQCHVATQQQDAALQYAEQRH